MIYISAETSVIVQGLDLQTLTLRSGSFGGTVRKTPLPMLHNAISPKDDFIFWLKIWRYFQKYIVTVILFE